MGMAFIDLKAQQERIKPDLMAAMNRVLEHGAYVMGPEVQQLERELAAFAGTRHCLSCANGTDALELALMVLGAGPGDAVFCPSFTFAATAEIVPASGAVPYFVDIDAETFNISLESLERCIRQARSDGLVAKGMIPVDLFGLPADYAALNKIAKANGMWMIEDAAQGFGARRGGKVAGSFGDIATTSFFPAKPLGCYGDGGAIFTDNDDHARLLDSLRIHGKGSDKYNNERIGRNSRLDTLQAAVLVEKLKIFPSEIEARNVIADRYRHRLGNAVVCPSVPANCVSTWAQYTILVANLQVRKKLQADLQAEGIPTAVYYPIPLHRQVAYLKFPRDPQGLAVSDSLCDRVVSLPMHPYLAEAEQDRICQAVREAVA